MQKSEEKKENPDQTPPKTERKEKNKKRRSRANKLVIVSLANALDNNVAAANYYGVPESSVRRWREQLKDALLPPPEEGAVAEIQAKKTTTRGALFQLLEEKVYEWIKEQRSKNLPLSQGQIREYAVKMHRAMPEYRNTLFHLAGFIIL